MDTTKAHVLIDRPRSRYRPKSALRDLYHWLINDGTYYRMRISIYRSHLAIF